VVLVLTVATVVLWWRRRQSPLSAVVYDPL
jgi:hypothetical protein